jgi:hypothetical protein
MVEPKKAKAPHVLDELVARAGKNNPKLLDAVVQGTSNDELVATGSSIATPRLITDGVRLYGEALDFFEGASAAQKRQIRGVSLALVQVAIHHLAALRALQGEVAARSQGTAVTRVTLDVEARAAVTDAVELRDQAYDALRDAAGTSSTARVQIRQAFGVADPPEALATGLDAMADLLVRWLSSDDAALVTRLALANLDGEYADELRAAALAVRTAVAAAAKRTSGKANQAALDREDGVQTLLLGQIIRAFEAAHARDATIPRLVPISTRRLFNRNGSRRESPAPAPAEPGKPA